MTKSQSTTSSAEAAREYIEAGLSVTPTTGKKPILDDYYNVDIGIEDISKYFNNGQGIGIKTGAPSKGVVDIDLDVPEAVKIVGRFLPLTRTSGRETVPDSHWWYVSPGAESLTFKDVDKTTLVELRADGRQTVVWPTIHPDDGDRYIWNDNGVPMENTPPGELTRLAREVATTALIARHVPPEGGRHDYALPLAGFMLRDSRFDEDTTLKILNAAWYAAGADSREAQRDLEGIVKDTSATLAGGKRVKGGPTLDGIVEGFTKAMSKIWGWERETWDDPAPLPSGLPAVDDLDPALLPESLHPYLEDVADRMQVPIDYLASAMMVAISSLVGRAVAIRPKRHDDWAVIPNLWGMLIGRPALMKTPAVEEVLKPLKRLAVEARKVYEEELEEYELDQMIVESEMKAYKKNLDKLARDGDRGKLREFAETEKPEEPEPPTLKRYTTEDATIEKLLELLIENPKGILVHRDELAGWFRNLDKQGREGDRAFYLEGWNGNGSFSMDRIGRGSTHAAAVCLSILGTIQPGPISNYVYQATQGELGDDGLLQRYQLTVYPDAPKTWRNVDRYPNADAKNKVFEIFQELDKLKANEAADEDNMPAVRFDSDGQDVFDAWRFDLEHRLRSEEMSSALEAHLAKYRSLMPSLALLFELVDSHGTVESVGARSALRAAAWCSYLESHARRLYAAAENPEIASARTLLQHVQHGDVEHGMKVREMYLKGWSGLSSPEEAKAALGVLEDLGWLRTVEVKTGGRPAQRIELHPSLREAR